MALETIAVVYEPLGTILGVPYYHGTIVYTNSSGQQFMATSGPSINPSGSTVSNFIQAQNAIQIGGQSPYGTLDGVSGPIATIAAKYPQLVNEQLNPNNPVVVVAQGTNLANQFATILTTENEIFNENLTYAPFTENSNSVYATALTAAGIQPPSSVGLLGSYWAPAAGDILQTPLTSASVNQAQAAQTTAQFNTAMAAGNNSIVLDASELTGPDGSITVSGAEINVLSGINAISTGSNDTFIMGTGSTVKEIGSANTFSCGTNSVVFVNGTETATCNNNNLAISGSGVTASVAANSAVSISGTGNNYTLDAGSTINITSGGNNSVICGGVQSTITGSAALSCNAGVLSVTGGDGTVTANNETIDVAPGSTVTIDGSGDIINAAAGADVTIGGKGSTIPASDRVNASDATVTVVADFRVNIFGSSDTVSAAFSVFPPFLFFQKILSKGLSKLDLAFEFPIHVMRKGIAVFFMLTILAACSTPTQQDFEKEVAGRAKNGMPVQEAINKLKDSGLTCTEYPKYFDCSRIKQNVLPPTSCTEKLTFVQNEQGLVSDMTIWKPACAGF